MAILIITRVQRLFTCFLFKFSADLKKKRSLCQIGLFFCKFSLGPKRTKATILKLLQGKGQFWGGMLAGLGGAKFLFGGTALLCPPLVVALHAC